MTSAEFAVIRARLEETWAQEVGTPNCGACEWWGGRCSACTMKRGRKKLTRADIGALLEVAERAERAEAALLRAREVLATALTWGNEDVPRQMSEATGEDIEDCEWCGEPTWFVEARAVLAETGAASDTETP